MATCKDQKIPDNWRAYMSCVDHTIYIIYPPLDEEHKKSLSDFLETIKKEPFTKSAVKEQ